MGRQITMATRNELVEKLRKRYRTAGRVEKSRILDEFVAVSGYHRKHATRVMGTAVGSAEPEDGKRARRIYGEAAQRALVILWETSDRICGKRLKAALPTLVESMEDHGHLRLEDELRSQLLAMSAATIVRLLAPAREHSTTGKKRRRSLPSTAIRRTIPVRTFADWNDPKPGFFEGDFVAHCGGVMAGSFLHTMTLTDIASGWTECMPLVARQQELVTEALDAFRSRLPIDLVGLDTDNDSAFINASVIAYCERHSIEFTRSRPYRSNDQAWVEQKNGAVVRRMVGYGRLEGVAAAKALGRLLGVARQFVNFFQPSFKLREKIRTGAKVAKRYDPPATPCDRLLANPNVSDEVKQELRTERAGLDPVGLLKALREAQEELVAGASIQRESLDDFLRSLPEQWKSGDARATHRKKLAAPRTWRTRKDPFEKVWPSIQAWLEAAPDVTAKAVFERLQLEEMGNFVPGQLRTLQRRVKEWRASMAVSLVRLGTESINDLEAVHGGEAATASAVGDVVAASFP